MYRTSQANIISLLTFICTLFNTKSSVSDPDPGRSELAPQKGKKGETCLKSLNVLSRSLRRNFPIINFYYFFSQYILVWIRIRIGSVLSNRLDPDPDSAKYLDQCIRIRNTAKNAWTTLSSTQLSNKSDCLPSLFVISFLAPCNSVAVTPAWLLWIAGRCGKSWEYPAAGDT